MYKVHSLAYTVALVLLCSCSSRSGKDGIYNILDWGAIPDGTTLTTLPIQQAIDQCAQDGGGKVLVPKGDYLVGTLNLRSNVDFHFEKGGRLIASLDLGDFQRHSHELAGVFYTEEAENVSITGPGIIFGQGMEYMYADSLKALYGPDYAFTRQGEHCRRLPDGVLGDGPVEPRDRFHQMIVFCDCKDITLADFKCIDSPFWCFIIAHCDGVRVHGLTIDNNNLIPNSDGIDFISTGNVLVSDCNISCGDDALVFTGYTWHFGDPGVKDIRRPMRNINVSDCNLRSRSSAIRIGLWDRNPLSDLNFSNINIYDSNCGIGISVRDSCGVENVNFTNINIHTRLFSGDWWGNGEPVKITAIRDDNFDGNSGRTYTPGAIRNIRFNNVNAVGENSILLYASEESCIENVSFTDCDFRLRQSALDEIGGGNFDLRPNSVTGKQFFQHDTPVVYAENIKSLHFTGVTTSLEGIVTKPYIRNGIVQK